MKSKKAFLTGSVLVVFCLLGAAVIPALSEVNQDHVPVDPAVEILPSGGGVMRDLPRDRMHPDQTAALERTIRKNVERLMAEGKIEPARPDLVSLDWPIRSRDGFSNFHVDAISNYVDDNLFFPNQVSDYNCGNRSYDLADGYNHLGVDILPWPFWWNKMDRDEMEVVAAARGTIVAKVAGQADRNCGGFNSSPNWNVIAIRHDDGSNAWYGHLKRNSLTTKTQGQVVEKGEFLGLVGSSGPSTAPHLHLEIRINDATTPQDPFQGPCNQRNAQSWWNEQQPYRNSRINKLMTHSAAPVFPACPNPEIENEKNSFSPGETVTVGAYYRDQLAGQESQLSLIRPDGTVHESWSHTAPDTGSATYWLWTRPLPTGAPGGDWKFRAVYNGETYEHTFQVLTASVTGRVLTPAGLGVRNAVVSLIDSSNVVRLATTSSFGQYRFDDVDTGRAYTLTVASKRYRFAPAELTAAAGANVVDLVGLE